MLKCYWPTVNCWRIFLNLFHCLQPHVGFSIYLHFGGNFVFLKMKLLCCFRVSSNSCFWCLKVELKVGNTVQIISGNTIQIEVEVWLIDFGCSFGCAKGSLVQASVMWIFEKYLNLTKKSSWISKTSCISFCCLCYSFLHVCALILHYLFKRRIKRLLGHVWVKWTYGDLISSPFTWIINLK